MGYEVFALGDGHHAYIDRTLQQKIKELVKRHWTPAAGDTVEGVQKEILAHPYLRLDEWAAAAHRERYERWRRSEKMLAGFKERLANGEIELRGVRGTTGQTAITIEKLRDRAVPHLDVAPDHLLIELERHPQGSGIVQDHYWLYSQRHKWAELLRPISNVSKVKLDNLLRQDSTGNWSAFGGPRDEFYRLAESKLGLDGLKGFKRLTTFQLLPIASPSDEILKECQRLTGFDFSANERSLRAKAEKRYARKYGPKEQWRSGHELLVDKGVQLHMISTGQMFRQFAQDVESYIEVCNFEHRATQEATVLHAKDTFSLEINISGSTPEKSIHVSLDGNRLQFRSNQSAAQSAELRPVRKPEDSGKYSPSFLFNDKLISSKDFVALILDPVLNDK
jgi:hypothetical protein